MSYNPFSSYGYSYEEQKMVSQKTQEEQKQNIVDEEQDVEIQKISDDNAAQQEQIDENSAINNEQKEQIEDLYRLIESIPSSGGTITDLDCGTW
jgi:uncharacterized membrane protein YhiD involved in acid resistance